MDDNLPPRQWEWTAFIPMAAGLYALHLVDGIGSGIFAGLPGVMLLGTGFALLLMRGDHRVTAYMAIGGLLGLLCALPLIIASGFVAALVIAALSAASLIVAGRISLVDEPTPREIPTPEMSLQMQGKVAFDEAIMGYFLLRARVPTGHDAAARCDMALEFERALDARGYIAYPEKLHAIAPPAPEQVHSEAESLWGHRYEHVSFDSGFVPDAQLPGASRWMEHAPNSRAHAWVMQHHSPGRPWLLCIHGYRMGVPWIDYGMFSPNLLHQKFGCNLVNPILPLHGPRRIGMMTGDGYLDGDLLDLVFAQTQALWDLRRWIAWIRASDASARIGVYGVSLGGYNTALLSCYEPDLDFTLAAIPVLDFAGVLWRVLPPPLKRYFAARGLDEPRYRNILRCVSPLSRPSRVPQERRAIVAANADRVVPVGQPLLLAKHWDVQPRFYAGSHLSIAREYEPRALLEEQMRLAGWLSPAA
jgi:hypothetical protein